MDMESLRSVKTDPIHWTRPNIIVKYKALSNTLNPLFPVAITYGAVDIDGPTSKAEVPLRYAAAKYYEIEQSGHIPWRHNPSKFCAILDDLDCIRGCLLPSSS
jgi:pimeloyl-ACP methyl ester carboxylesterase